MSINENLITIGKEFAIPDEWIYKEERSRTNTRAVKNNSGKWGFIEKNGKLAIPCKWEKVLPSAIRHDDNDRIIFPVMDGGVWGCIDKSGTLVVPCKWATTYDAVKWARANLDVGAI